MFYSRNLSLKLYSHHRPIYIFNHATSQYICYNFSFLVKNTSKGLRSNCCPFSSYSTPPYNDQILSVGVYESGCGCGCICCVCGVCEGVCGCVWGVCRCVGCENLPIPVTTPPPSPTDTVMRGNPLSLRNKWA